MVKVSPSEFARNFARYNEAAREAPVAVGSGEHATGYFISAEEFAAYSRLKAMARKAYAVEELPEDVLRAIGEARMDPRHDHLNELLDD